VNTTTDGYGPEDNRPEPPQPSDVAPLTVAESTDPVRWVNLGVTDEGYQFAWPEAPDETKAALEAMGIGTTVAEDLLAKVNAGAALAYSLYHAGADTMRVMPDPVIHAYMRATEAYGIGRRNPRKLADDPQ
jgi:hypothetical protein